MGGNRRKGGYAKQSYVYGKPKGSDRSKTQFCIEFMVKPRGVLFKNLTPAHS